MLYECVYAKCIHMIDKFSFRIPFKPDSVLATESADAGRIDMLQTGITAFNKCTVTVTDGQPVIEVLEASYESLPSSFTPMAMKVHNGGTYWPFVEIKASPAKLLQGHNVYGPDCPVLCGRELFYTLDFAMPDLSAMLDYGNAEIYEIDCTYSFDFQKVELGLPLIEFMSHVESGHCKIGQVFDTTCYWKYKSDFERLKLYLKWHELQKNISSIRHLNKAGVYDHVIEVMKNPRLQQFAATKARLEANIRHRRLKELGISNYWVFCRKYEQEKAEGGNLIQRLWQRSFKPLFEAVGDKTMNLHNDEDVKRALMARYGKQNSKGKMNYAKALNYFRTYRSIATIGYDETAATMSRPTFWRHVTAIAECGISKGRLQNLHQGEKGAQVVPLIRLIEVDFSSQFPADYVEPTSNYCGQFKHIRANSSHYPHLRVVA